MPSTSPSAIGSDWIDGVDHTDTPPHLRGVGLMFQDYALFPHLDVSANVAYGLRMAGVPPDDRTDRVEDLLEMVGLSGVAHRRIDGLSGGEQQRVALARTLAPKPRLVLLDEPLGSLDQALKDDLLAQTRAIVTELGIAAVYVTHDRMEAEAFADRIAIMRDGRIARVGAPQALWEDPGTEFVARLMGHRTIVDGHTVGASGRVLVLDHAITEDPDGPIHGVVIESAFRDGRYRVTADVAGERLALWSDGGRTTGDPIRLRIVPSGVVPLTEDP